MKKTTTANLVSPNYVELRYSEVTFTCKSFDSKSNALSNFFQIDRIDEFAEKGSFSTNSSILPIWKKSDSA